MTAIAIEGIAPESIPSDPGSEMILAAREFAECVFRVDSVMRRKGDYEDALTTAFQSHDVIGWADAKIAFDTLHIAFAEAVTERGKAEARYQRARIAAGLKAR